MKVLLSVGLCLVLLLLQGDIEVSGGRLILPNAYGNNGNIEGDVPKTLKDHLPVEELPKIHGRERRAATNEEGGGLSQFNNILVGTGGLMLLMLSLAICSSCCGKKEPSSCELAKSWRPGSAVVRWTRNMGSCYESKLTNEPDAEGNLPEVTTLASHTEDVSNGSTTKDPVRAEENQSLLTDKNLPNDKTTDEPPTVGEVPDEPPVEDESRPAPIPKGQLANSVQKLARTNDGYKEEFEALESNDIASVDRSQINANKPKNRFKNILPYDHTLVKLNEGDEYINASFITGYGGRERAYIATQGPLESTREAFWRMVWQEGCTEIIMLANLMENKKRKCSKYWPDVEEEEAVYGSITVTNKGEVTEVLQYTVRTFQLEKEGIDEKRTVRQYHFTAWGDMSDINSATPIWEILRQLRADRAKPDDKEGSQKLPPIVVHCSAGCGRTGTVITLDVMRIMMKRDNQADIFNFVNQMRSERMNMVQVLTQYRFIYESVLIYMRLKRTCFPPEIFLEKLGEWETPTAESTMSTLQKQYHLYSFLHPALAEVSYAGEKPENSNKNRDPSKIPGDINRPLLQTQVPDDDTATNYINACFFNGYSKRSRFLATQAPLQSTYTDMWRMIWDYKSGTIIGFQGDDREKFPLYWPSDSAELGPFTVENKGEDEVSDNLTIRDFELKKVSDKQGGARAIRQYCIHGFDELAPDQQVALLVDLVTKQVRPRIDEDLASRVTVHCEYGTGLSGVVIGLINATDMLTLENQVGVFTIVKLLRISRHDIIDTFEMYKLLNNAVKYYIQNPTTEAEDEPDAPDEEKEEEGVYVNMS